MLGPNPRKCLGLGSRGLDEVCALQGRDWWASGELIAHQDGRVVKALDLRSNGRMPAWVRTPLLVGMSFFSWSKPLTPAFGALVESREGTYGPCTWGVEAIQCPSVRTLVGLRHPVVQAEHRERREASPSGTQVTALVLRAGSAGTVMGLNPTRSQNSNLFFAWQK